MLASMALSHQDEALASTLLVDVRRALQARDIDQARTAFLRLPALERLHEKWLEDVLRDAYTAGLFDINAVLSFLESLPNWTWTLDGCCVLHRVNVSLETATAHVVHVPTLPLAYFLHKLVNHLDGSVKVRAESYWYEWVSPTMRAIVMGKPLVIESFLRREVLYTPTSSFAFDFDRRNVFTWRQPWTPDERKEQWRLVPASVNRDRFFLQSVQYDEYLYAADYAKFRRDERGNLRSRVFGWRKRDDPVGDAGHWQLVPIDPQNRDVFAIYNPYQKEYLYSPNDVYDRERRYVFTAAHCPKDAAWMEERKWRIIPLHLTPMEKGIEAFFMKKYPEAVELLTEGLHDESDQAEHVKCYVYRMTANLRMGNTELIKGDFDKVEAVGGDKAAIFHGLHHLWNESAAFLQLSSDIREETHCATAMVSVDHHIQRGDQLFVMKDYEVALGAFEEAACAQLDTEDPALRSKQMVARLSSAKCHFAMHRTDAALAILKSLMELSDQLASEMEARVLMWMGRCKRQQKQYEQAVSLLEKALDKLATTAENNSGHQWLKQCVVIELQVVGIHRKELLDNLLERCEEAASQLPRGRDEVAPHAAENIVQQMVDLFHCPLSLELMQDPVMTPNGDTYERDMIERHLEVNGQFDPMTRSPLTKSQLYPNRALKMLMDTLLSEHKLGLLLASCST